MTEPTTFPKTLYVEIRQPSEGGEEHWYSASNSIADLAEVDKKIKVGVYQLTGLQEVEFQVVSTTVGGRP